MSAQSHEQLIENISKMSVMELSDLVKALETKFGVSASMPMMAAAPVAAAPVAEERASYKVTLTDGGPEKIKTIKALRQVLPALNLSDAKKAVEEVPSLLAESAPKADAEKIKKELEAVGAKVELA